MTSLNFNPRTPYGVRPSQEIFLNCSSVFQPTHSIRSATSSNCCYCYDKLISTHALHTECDNSFLRMFSKSKIFQPTHSIRSATVLNRTKSLPSVRFQPTHSIRSATYLKIKMSVIGKISTHALHTECDYQVVCQFVCVDYFNPRTPYGVRLLYIDI